MRIGMQELLIILAIVVIIFGPTQIPQEWVIIGVVVLLVLGPTQIPKLTRMFGKSAKAFKEGMEEDEDKASEKPSDEE